MTAYNIRQVTNDKTETIVTENGPSTDDLIEGLNSVPDKSQPIKAFLQIVPNGPALPVLISTIGYDPATNGATMIVVPDLSDEAADEVASQGIFPR